MPENMSPRYMPRTIEQKLGYLVEECGEVLAAVGKTLRWGPDSFNPEPGASRETNREWVLRELPDLERAIGFVRAALATARQQEE
jgi:NTP pyrophosphatase (non-canonical NTP hydrolase)